MSTMAMPIVSPVLQVRRTGLWVFMGVVTMLFLLFSIAFMMRMAADDWRALPEPPWQLWASTALLCASSVAWGAAARGSMAAPAMRAADRAIPAAMSAAMLLSLAFIGMQLWGWQAMAAMHYGLAANPANSFFYMITGLHGLHVLGGLVVAALLWRKRRSEASSVAISLCARYWHYLLGLWLAMYGLLFLMTPERFDAICSSFK
jgi:cytochrome c oxidase subunit 3